MQGSSLPAHFLFTYRPPYITTKCTPIIVWIMVIIIIIITQTSHPLSLALVDEPVIIKPTTLLSCCDKYLQPVDVNLLTKLIKSTNGGGSSGRAGGGCLCGASSTSPGIYVEFNLVMICMLFSWIIIQSFTRQRGKIHTTSTVQPG